jgi:hypothetical protein
MSFWQKNSYLCTQNDNINCISANNRPHINLLCGVADYPLCAYRDE